MSIENSVWIGGPAAAGKTTIARLLARKRGLRWYSTDAHSWSHRDRAIEQGLHRPDDPAPGDYDRGPMILQDLASLGVELPHTGVIVEGAIVTPTIAPIIDRAVWLMPSPSAHRDRLSSRSRSSDQLEGPLQGRIIIEDQLRGTPAVRLCPDAQTMAETLAAVDDILRAPLINLPAARSRHERQLATRFGNAALVDQLRTSVTRRVRMPPDTTLLLDCECGAPWCRELVPVSAADAVPVGSPDRSPLAANH